MASYTLTDPAYYHPLGTIAKAHHLDGRMVVKGCHRLDFLPAPSTIWCYQHHSYVPYAVASWEAVDTHAVVAMEGVENRTYAEALCHTALFLMKDDVLVNVLRQEGLLLQGYKVVDATRGVLGRVVAVIYRQTQPLIVIDYKGQELFVPLHARFVKAQDDQGGTLYVALGPAYWQAVSRT